MFGRKNSRTFMLRRMTIHIIFASHSWPAEIVAQQPESEDSITRKIRRPMVDKYSQGRARMNENVAFRTGDGIVFHAIGL
jgi:hypothetical protein